MLNIIQGNMRVYILGYIDGVDTRFYLHSDGQMLTTPEYWPTRADAETILAKYPDATPLVVGREWKHGDVFRYAGHDNTGIVLMPDNGKPTIYYLYTKVVLDDHNIASKLYNATFLFNVNDVVKERQAAESGDER